MSEQLVTKKDFDLDFSKMYEKFFYFRSIENKKIIFQDVESIRNSEECKVAFDAQTLLENAMLYLSKEIKKKFPNYKNLCLSGGSALNLSANRKVYDTNFFEPIEKCC